MKSKLLFSGLFSLLVVTCAWAADPFERINPPQPTQSGDRIEVVEVFWYGCPHCYALEPYLDKWLETKPDDVEFRRIPGVLGRNWLPHARAYYTAEKLGILGKIHQQMFNAIHVERTDLGSEKKLASFFKDHGVDHDEFMKTYESEEITDKIKQAFVASQGYGLTGVPAIIVNGKYRVSASTAGGNARLIEVVNMLIEQERKVAMSGKK
jgi:thiol:disulfide interchange protein DsbA